MEDTSLAKENGAVAAPALREQGSAPLPFLRPLRGRALEWLGEIAIVFVGVSAAFGLNTWQSQWLDRTRHLQILQLLDEDTADSIRSIKAGMVKVRADLDGWQRQLAAGEMPALHLMSFSTDYDPADDLALSQAGADRLLDFKTLQAMRKVSSVQRTGFMDLRKYQQLSYELVAPRLNDPKESFYDPQTKQLKPMFKWYLDALRDLSEFMRDDLAASEALLAQVKAERATLR